MKRFQENAQHISERPSPSDRMPGWARSYVHTGETSLDGKTCSSGGAKGRRGVATDSPSLQGWGWKAACLKALWPRSEVAKVV